VHLIHLEQPERKSITSNDVTVVCLIVVLAVIILLIELHIRDFGVRL
jgi:hypothetical protein